MNGRVEAVSPEWSERIVGCGGVGTDLKEGGAPDQLIV